MRVSSDVNRPTSPEAQIVPWLAWPSRNLKLDVCAAPGDTHSVSEPSIASSSQSDQPDVDDDGEVRLPVTDDSCLFV